jgi:uncharacterized protein (TIGR03437 family)
VSETIPHGTQMTPGQSFTKSWTLHNSGTSSWNSSYSLQYVSGNAGCSHSALAVSETVAPSSTYTFSISCPAPTTAGTYREDWRLVGPAGTIPVGASPTVYLIINVKPSQTAVDAVTVVSETVPDGSQLLPGENFVKVWRLKNAGTTTWTNYRAAFVQSPGVGATSVNLLASGASTVPIPTAAPGDIVDLSLAMRVPTTPGVYASYWQLQSAAGTPFGTLLDVQIQVQSGGITLQIAPRQTYEAATRTLVLAASATDSLSRAVTTGNFNWSLRDSSGVQRAAGNLTYQNGEWGTRYTMPAPLSAGLYSVQYSLTDGGRSGSAVGSFSVGDLVDITGTVRDGKTRAPLPSVEVRAGGKVTQTDASGKYVLSGLSPSALTTITGTKAGYISYDVPVNAMSGSRTIVRDFELFPSSPSKPVITGLTAQYEGTFLAGVPFTNRYAARVTWNGSPGTVEFYYDGKPVASVPGSASGAEASFDIGSGSSSSPVIRTLRVIARNEAGATSDPFEKKTTLAPLPNWLKRLQGYLICGVGGALSGELGRVSFFPSCATTISLLDVQKVLPISVLGRLGAEVSVGAEVEYDVRSAQLDIAVGAEVSKEWEKAGARPTIPFLTRQPRLKFYVGNVEVSGSLRGGARGTFTFARGWEDLRPLIKGSLEGRFEGTRINLLNYFGGLGTALDWIGLRQVTDLTSFPIYVIIGADGEVVFVLEPGLKIESGELNGSFGVELAYEPKLGGLAELRAYAGGKAALQLLPEPFKDFALQVYAGYRARLWKWEDSREFILIEYPSSSGRGAQWIAIPVWSPDPREGFRPLKRDYLDAGPAKFAVYEPGTGKEKREAAGVAPLEQFRSMGSGYPRAAAAEYHVELPLLTNTFPYSEPSLAARGNELMLVYVADSGSADPARFTDIHYSFFNGTDWSQPEPISTDIRAEFDPKVAFDGSGDAIAVWEREKDATLAADASIEALASKIEIVWSRWDGSTRTWSTPAPLTDNDHLDHSPLLIGPMEDGGLIAVWTENPSNLLVGRGAEGSATASRVWWVRWDAQSRSWGQPSILVPSVVGRLSQSLAGAGRRAIYAWTRDTDSDPATSSDQELFYAIWDGQGWSPVRQLTRDTIPDRNVRAAVTPSGEIFLVWQHGNDLVLDRNLSGPPTVIRPDSGTLGFEDFTLTAGPSGNLVLLWQDRGTRGTDVFYRVFDPASSSWSADLQLTNDRDLERSLAPAWDSADNLTLAYNLVAVNEVTKWVTLADGRTVQVEGALEFGQVDLRVLKRALRRDVGFRQGGLTVDCAPCLPGQTATVQAQVENLGDLPVSDVTVAFYAGDPSRGGREIGRATIPGLLRAGENATAKTQWIPSGPFASQDLFAVVDPDNRVSETDETNNTVPLRVGGPDLSLSLRSASAEPDGSARIVVEIRNAGTVASGAAQATVTPPGVPASPLGTADVPALNLSESAEVALTLAPGSVRGEQSQFEVTVTYAGDVNTANNKIRVAIQPAALELKAVETPLITPQGGQFTGPISATIVCATEGAIIQYTTNGKDPTEEDPVIPSGATVPITSSVTLKAKAWKSGWVESAVATAFFAVSGSSPVVSESGIVNAASFKNLGGLAPGSLITVFGSGFATSEFSASSVPLPTTLGSVQVLVNGAPAPLFYVGPRQINLQLPPELGGATVSIVVRANGAAAREIPIPLASVDPATFQVGQTGYGTIVKANTDILAMPVTPGIKSAPARRGDIVSIYCTGLGLTETRVPAGVAAPSAIPTLLTPRVSVGGRVARVLYSGTAPGFVGLNQVNVEIPQDALTGAQVPVLIEMDGKSSPPVNMAIE